MSGLRDRMAWNTRVGEPTITHPATQRKDTGMSDDVNDLGFDFIYPLDQAVEDGLVVKLFEHRWEQLSGGKPIVATAHLAGKVSEAALIEVWNEFVAWRREVLPTLPVEDQQFETTINDERVWVIEDAAAFTMLYPEDY